MKPPRPDIAVPPLPPDVEWIGQGPSRIERLTAAGPVLVHFIDVGHLSSVRTLPYLAAWHERYSGLGLSILGVNTPRFPFTAEGAKRAAALKRLAVPFPVANDRGTQLWRSYGCKGWPSAFLWSQGGALAWFHFGEGEYEATEREIQALLPETAREAGLPEPVEPVRPSDVSGAKVMPPSEEVFPGGDPERPWRARPGGEALSLDYQGAGAAVTVDGYGEIAAVVDDGASRAIEVDAPGVYEVAEHGRHGAHRVVLDVPVGVEVYCVAFAPGVP